MSPSPQLRSDKKSDGHWSFLNGVIIPTKWPEIYGKLGLYTLIIGVIIYGPLITWLNPGAEACTFSELSSCWPSWSTEISKGKAWEPRDVFLFFRTANLVRVHSMFIAVEWCWWFNPTAAMYQNSSCKCCCLLSNICHDVNVSSPSINRLCLTFGEVKKNMKHTMPNPQYPCMVCLPTFII